MTGEDPELETLKERQLAQEQVARQALDQADTEADATKQERRVDKARYLREKLQQREQADRDAARKDR